MVSGQACNPPDLINVVLFPLVEELYGTQYQNGFFFIINVGSGFLNISSIVGYASCPFRGHFRPSFNLMILTLFLPR
jgi:hypothetical protein